MRNKLLVFVFAFCLGRAGCTTHPKMPAEKVEPFGGNFTGTHFTTADSCSVGIPVITSEPVTMTAVDMFIYQ